MIKLKINVLAIDKARLFKGSKGTYLDACLIETPNNAYGDDYMIVQDVSKEERERGEKGAILGNAKVIGGVSQYARVREANASAENLAANPEADDIPW